MAPPPRQTSRHLLIVGRFWVSPEGQGEDAVIVVASAVLAGGLEQGGLLDVRERPRRALDGGGVGGRGTVLLENSQARGGTEGKAP
jgi:hypothetical protein